MLRAALQRLRDPEKHLIDELFWFWPPESDDAEDPGQMALRSGDCEAATAAWIAAQQDGASKAAIALHNLAVLALVGVLDSELEVRDSPSAGEQDGPTAEAWATTYARWGELRTASAFWTALQNRVHEIQDPRLNDDVVWSIRRTLPEALASIASRLAVSLWFAGRSDASVKVLDALWASGLPQADIKRAVKVAIEPVRTRLKTSIQTAEREVRSDDSGNRPLDVAKRLLEQCEPLLLIVDAALPKGDAARAALHDDLALAVLHFTVAWVNTTDNYAGAAGWVDRASGLAEGDAAIERIRENQSINNGNLTAQRQYQQAVRRRSSASGRAVATGTGAAAGCAGWLIRSFGILIVLAILGGVISLAEKGCGCDQSSSSSSASSGYSSSAYDQTNSDEPAYDDSSASTDSGSVSTVDYYAIANKVDSMIAFANRQPRSISDPSHAVADGFRAHATSIRKWVRKNDPNGATRRMCEKAVNMAMAAAALYDDPYSDSKWSRFEGNLKLFNKVWKSWTPGSQ